MKTREADVDEKKAVEEKRTTDEPGWTRMENGVGGHPISVESARPRKRFPIRASEGSSVFKLLFPG